MDAPEMLLCAAVWTPTRIWIGRTYDECYSKMEQHGIDTSRINPENEGFSTSRNRFVRKAEAARIAWSNGQLTEPVENLQPEYLW